MRRVGETIIVVLVALTVCGAALTLLPPWHPFLEWNSGQIPIYLVMLSIGLPLILFCSRWPGRTARGVLTILVVAFLARFVALHTQFFFAAAGEQFDQQVDTSNVSLLTLRIDSAAERSGARALLSSEPDLIAVRGDEAAAFAREVVAASNGRLHLVAGDRVALLSRFPVIDTPRDTLGDDASSGLVAIVSIPGDVPALVTVLSLPPLRSGEAALRNRRAMRRVATLARHFEGAAIVVGDLAARTTSHTFSFLTVGGDLRDAAWGRGGRIEGDFFPLHRLFSSDHLLVKGGTVRDLAALSWSGAGPRPLRAEILLPRGAAR